MSHIDHGELGDLYADLDSLRWRNQNLELRIRGLTEALRWMIRHCEDTAPTWVVVALEEATRA